MSDVVAVTVVRSGTALAFARAGRPPRLRRRKDLGHLLGQSGPATARFVSARLVGDDVELELEAGRGERLALRDLLGPAVDPRRPDLVLAGARVMTCDGPAGELGLLDRGAVAIAGGVIAWVGPADELGRAGLDLGQARRLDLGGRLLGPGLVDCHAHPIFAGSRADEFARRAAGQSYLEIAAAGGGIAATLGPTRAASAAELTQLTCARARQALASGTTTMEAKTGYDLTLAGEQRLLEVAWAADGLGPIDLWPTLLAAHVVPPEHQADRAAYVAGVERLIGELPAGLARAVDVYGDEGAFTLAECRTILGAAVRAGLPIKAHAGQFRDLGVAELCGELGALSADHLEQVSAAGRRALAAHGVIAVMLPGACVQLRLVPPDVAALRTAGVALAIGSDLNPGSSHASSLPLQMWLACSHYGLTVEEAWLGVTQIAARALGRHDVGALTAGAAADLVAWDVERPAEVPYRYGENLVHAVWKSGRAAIAP